MSLHPGTDRYNPAGNSDFTRKAEALALGITNWSTPKATDGAKGGPGQSYGSGGTPPLPAQAAQWPTPAAQNWKGSSEASITRADGKSRMEHLALPGGTGLHPPGPGDHAGWAAALVARPDLAPALGFDDCLAWARRLAADPQGPVAAAAEPALRRMADGLAHRTRALRLLGNGVHPLAAAHAWRSLATAPASGRNIGG